MRRQQTLFDSSRLSLDESIELTAQSLNAYIPGHKHIAVAYSGGKDSSATLTLLSYLIDTGRVQLPKACQVHVLYADTRQELPPLHFAAMSMLEACKRRGFKTHIVCAPLEKRFWPYILGRGVTSPNNGTFRWCTRQIKVDPMTTALAELRLQLVDDERLLMVTGVRLGESAARDQRIAMSCTKDGGECGQGWFQKMTAPQTDTVAPLLHWRVCHVWDWLVQADVEHGFPTMQVAEAYSMTESIEQGDEPIASRTGCIGCPLVSTEDTALARVCNQERWAYLAPLKELRAVHAEARKLSNRLRKSGGETRKDGSFVKNQGRFGPICLDVRLSLLKKVLDIQARVNIAAIAQGNPQISIINSIEELFIRKCIGEEVWPDGWTGNEPRGDEWIDEPLAGGHVQPLIAGLVS